MINYAKANYKINHFVPAVSEELFHHLYSVYCFLDKYRKAPQVLHWDIIRCNKNVLDRITCSRILNNFYKYDKNDYCFININTNNKHKYLHFHVIKDFIKCLFINM